MNDIATILDMIADDLVETTYNHLKGPAENDPEAMQFYKIADRIREVKERLSPKPEDLQWGRVLDYDHIVGAAETKNTCCYVCGFSFEADDWSTYISIKNEIDSALVHDDCLEVLRHGMWKNKPLFELGHKIWGEEL